MSTIPVSPFDLSEHVPSGFVIFEAGEHVALPLHALSKATLRGAGSHLVLRYKASDVVLDGTGLEVVLEHLLAAELRAVRCAKAGGVEIRKIQLVEGDV